MKLKMPARRTRFKIVVVVSSLALTTLLVVVTAGIVDVYLHRRYERSAGLNIWGYRGAVVGKKQAGEQRIAVLGGSTAFGYGVMWQEAFPAVLEQKLNAHQRSHNDGSVTVVNLAFNNEGAYSYRYTLRDYEYLDYDVAVLYAGYNDLGNPNTQVYRHQSPIFRLIGYVPMLPVVFQEKAMALRYGGDLEAAYRGTKTAFVPNRTARTTAATLEATARIAAGLERQLGRFAREYEFEPNANALCPGEWDFFCQQMHDAVDLALSNRKRVIVVMDPFMAEPTVRQRQTSQREALSAMLEARFRGRAVRYIGLGDAVDLADPSFQFDGMHLTVHGNEKIAEALLQPVLDVLNGPA